MGKKKINQYTWWKIIGATFLLLFLFIFFIKNQTSVYSNSTYGIRFSYPKRYKVKSHLWPNGTTPPLSTIYRINFIWPTFNTIIFKLQGGNVTDEVSMIIFDGDCSKSIDILTNHSLRAFSKPIPTDQRINQIKIYNLHNVNNQIMWEYDKFACIEGKNKSVFISAMPNIWKNGEQHSGLINLLLRWDSFQLFKKIIQSIIIE